MPPARSRSISILDVMIVTAAAGVGFALMRLCWPRSARFSPHAVREWASATAGAAMMPLTVAFVLIRLIRPRPRIERLMCQPGMAACCAGSVAILTGLGSPFLRTLGEEIHLGPMAYGPTWYMRNFFYIYNLPVGPAVVAVWVALLLAKRWRPERTWIDRLGRCIGWFWIIFMFFQWQLGRWTSALAGVIARSMK